MEAPSGLTWLKDAACLGLAHWAAANQAAATLGSGQCGLTDHSSPGDWRLPSRDEWAATIARAIGAGTSSPVLHCVPALTDTRGNICFGDGSTSAFVGVTAGFYWSNTNDEEDPPVAWYADLSTGTSHAGYGGDGLFQFLKNGPGTDSLLIWPVRRIK
jgi:hypothetical protein